jgi:hypothetical protein
MTEKASFVLVDAASTPQSPGTPAAANRTFTPGEMENGRVHTFYNTTTGTTVATRSKLTASITPGDTVTRVKYTLATPKAQTVDGVVISAHVTRCIMEFIIPNDATWDDRVDSINLAYGMLANTGLSTMVKELEDLW